MRRTFAIVFGFLILVTARSSAFQAGEQLKSGPQAGEPIPGSFHFLNINGAYAGDPHCLMCEYGNKPVGAVFARSLPETGKPLANLLQKLDETIGKNQASEFRGFCAFLSPDHAAEDTRKTLVQNLENAAKELKQFILCVGADSPDKYNINKDADVTVILYHNHKVVANFAYEKDKLGDKDVAAIVAAFQKMALKR